MEKEPELDGDGARGDASAEQAQLPFQGNQGKQFAANPRLPYVAGLISENINNPGGQPDSANASAEAQQMVEQNPAQADKDDKLIRAPELKVEAKEGA